MSYRSTLTVGILSAMKAMEEWHQFIIAVVLFAICPTIVPKISQGDLVCYKTHHPKKCVLRTKISRLTVMPQLFGTATQPVVTQWVCGRAYNSKDTFKNRSFVSWRGFYTGKSTICLMAVLGLMCRPGNTRETTTVRSKNSYRRGKISRINYVVM